MMFPLEYHLQATHYKPPDVEPKILSFQDDMFYRYKKLLSKFLTSVL